MRRLQSARFNEETTKQFQVLAKKDDGTSGGIDI